MLPSNELKLYLVFSAPMQGGDEIFSKIHLIESNGTPAYLPFVGQDLWNRDNTRLTLIFDPGRIKRGVKPNVDLGPVLVEGKHYTLIVDRGMKDAPTVSRWPRNSDADDFAAGPAERRGVDPKLWKFSQPHAGTVDPLGHHLRSSPRLRVARRRFRDPRVPGKRPPSARAKRSGDFSCPSRGKAGDHQLVIDMALGRSSRQSHRPAFHRCGHDDRAGRSHHRHQDHDARLQRAR